MKKDISINNPPAEGVDEILERAFNNGAIRRITYIPDIRGIISAMNDFATLHAQRLAEKMVSERLRKELMMFGDYFNNLDPNDHILVNHILVNDIDKYLKSKER